MTRSISSLADPFELRGGVLHCEDVPLPAIASAVGTPVYVYSSAAMRDHARALREALAGFGDPLIAYAVKANPNAAVIASLGAEGLGADIVSGGELERALAAGIPADKIVFSGVGKTRAEMCRALEAGICQFNLESGAEAALLSEVAIAIGQEARAGFRVNPGVEPGTHAKISTGAAESKFGIQASEALAEYARAAALPGLRLQGIAVHIGSQLTSLAPFEQAFATVGRLITELRIAGHDITLADLGGGLGVRYDPAASAPPSPADYGAMVERLTRGWDVRLVLEPGRFLVANAGVLLTEVIRVKPGATHPFVIVDAAMNDLMRPTLYDAWHAIEAVRPSGRRITTNVVGPVCETGDTFALGREMDAVEAGDLVVFRSAGAYAATMASTYNSRPLTPEVLVDGDKWAVVRPRIEVTRLIAGDVIPEWLRRR
jgi:diaminopimelate decarboxylase